MKIEIQDLFNDWEENEVHLPEEQTNVKAICSKTMEKINATPKKRHPLRTVLIAVAAAVLLCGSALAVPAVREAIGIKTERGINVGYTTQDGETQSVKSYTIHPDIILTEDATTRFETVYRPTYLPEGYSDCSSVVSANYAEDEEQKYSIEYAEFSYYMNDTSYLLFKQHLVVDCAADPTMLGTIFYDTTQPETVTVELGGVECQYTRGHNISDSDFVENTEQKVVYWSDGNYVFSLCTFNADVSDEELGRIIASIKPLEDYSPYLMVGVADESANNSMQTVYAPSFVPEGQKYDSWEFFNSNYSIDYFENIDGRLMNSWSIHSEDGDYMGWVRLCQFVYPDYTVQNILHESETVTRVINSTNVTFVQEIRHREGGDSSVVSAAWETNGYYFTATLDSTMEMGIDDLADIIAHLEPNEKLSTNAGVPIKTPYAPNSVPAGWEKISCELINPATWSVTYGTISEDTKENSNLIDPSTQDDTYFYSIEEDTKGFQLSQTTYNLFPFYNIELLLEEATECREIDSHNVSFYLEEDHALAVWQADGYYFQLELDYGVLGHELTVDEIAEIVASVEPDESEMAQSAMSDNSAEKGLETYYLPEVSDSWKLVGGGIGAFNSFQTYAGYAWISDDYAGLSFSQSDGDPTSTGDYHENTREEWVGNTELVINDGNILAIWNQDGYWMTLMCTDGDTTKWTVDNVMALVESVHEVEDITPYLTQPFHQVGGR